VAVARAFDAAGSLFLLPGRLILRRDLAFDAAMPGTLAPANTAGWLLLWSLFQLIRRKPCGSVSPNTESCSSSRKTPASRTSST